MIRRALRENGATVSLAAVSYTVFLLGHLASEMLNLENKLSAVLAILFVLYLLQRVLVGKRRCSRHWLVQYGAMAAYYLPTPLVFYLANAVCSSTSHINESANRLWFITLLTLCATIFLSSQTGACITNMTAYSLRDGPCDRWRFVLWVLYLARVPWEGVCNQASWCLYYMLLHFILVFHIILPAQPPKSTLDCETKVVADYMKHLKCKSSTSPFFDGRDANSLQLDCCRYPSVQGKDGEWVTVKDLVQRDRPPNEDKDKDICLSYSLCRLLARRYYGFHCAEQGDDQVCRFALADLGRRDGGYKRAFTIVEVQLAFLHDYFFTASLQTIELFYGGAFTIYKQVIKVLTLLVPIFQSFLWLAKGGHDTAEAEQGRTKVILVIISTALASLGLLYVLTWPVAYFLPIYWAPIQNSCFGSPNTKHIVMRLLGPIFHPHMYREHEVEPPQTHQSGVYWSNKIAQYSILHDYDGPRPLWKIVKAWFQGHVLSQPLYSFIKHLPVEEQDIKVPESVRKLVADTLWAINGPPTNGTRSLQINRETASYDWSWTCRQETHTDTILIWHIATCYCDMSQRHSDPSEDFPLLVQTDTCRKDAMALSRYCAYLVAFLPEFLAEHSLTTKQVFQRVIQEAQGALGKTPMEEKEKYTKMRELLLPHQHEQRTTFHKGVELGRQLEMLNDDKVRWKVIAEFWAETILYVAPSDKAEAHIEQLAKGGEFITHLWAMLSNAGILKRAEGEWHPPASTTKLKEPPKKMETTKARTQECPF